MALLFQQIALLCWQYVQFSIANYSRNYAGIMCQPLLLSTKEYFCYLNKLSGNNRIDSQDHRRYLVQVLRVTTRFLWKDHGRTIHSIKMNPDRYLSPVIS